MPSKFPDEVLAGGAAGHAAGIDVDHHDPFDVVRVAVHGEREQVRAFPLPAGGIGGPEFAQRRPVLEVGGLVEDHLVLLGFHRGHHPVAAAAGCVVPEDLGVAEVRRVSVQDRVARRTWSRSGRRPGCRPGTAPAGRDAEKRPCRRWCRSRSGAGSLSCRNRTCCPCPPRRCRRRCPAGRRWRSPAAAPPSGQGPWTWRGPRTCSPRCCRRGCAGSTGGRRPCGRRARWGRSSSFFRACSGWPAGSCSSPRSAAADAGREPASAAASVSPARVSAETACVLRVVVLFICLFRPSSRVSQIDNVVSAKDSK